MSPQVLPSTAAPAAAQQQSGQPPASAEQQAQQAQRQGGAAPPPGATVLELLDSFLVVQQERAAAYRRFDTAFRAYLQNQLEGPFRYVMGQLTQEFQQLSQRVLTLEAALRQHGSADLAAVLRTVQDNEREKLRLTLALHALKSAHAQQRFSWQHEEAAAGLAPGVADLLQGHMCGVGCAHGAPADEPTQAEYAAAVRESYQLLQSAVTAINDALDEVREAQQELLAQ